MNKRKNISTIVLTLLIIFSTCNTKELQDLNIDPTAANEIDPGFILAYTQIQTSGERYENWRAVLIYQSTMIQHFATLPTYWAGDKYLYIQSYSASLWERAYRNYIKDLVNLIAITDPSIEGNEDLVNYYNIARIWKVFAFHRVTDHYGDVPYSEAGLGFLETNFNPKYDPQSEIYADMLKELEEAAAGLDASKPNPGKQDLIYGGDIAKWKKFAYSMMLRLGMRLVKVAPNDASSWVGKALDGGVMESNDDICYIQHGLPPDRTNGIGEVFYWNGERYATDDSPRLSETFVNMLRSKNDPRLEIYSWRQGVDGMGGPAKGMPNGYDATTIKSHPSWPVDPDPTDEFDPIDDYSRIEPLFVLRSSPMIFMTYAEVCYLTAEAIERGWYSGDAAIEYEKGVRAAMKQLGLYDASLEVPDPDIAAYLAANPYNSAEWERILGEEFWIATFLNEYEAYANWRRTGYPQLTPVNYPGNESNGQIPRRLRYPAAEQSLNPEKYNEAINRQGPDEFTTRIWWDVEL